MVYLHILDQAVSIYRAMNYEDTLSCNPSLAAINYDDFPSLAPSHHEFDRQHRLANGK